MKKINKKRVHWQANVASHIVASPFPVVPIDVDGSIYNMMMVRHVILQP